MTPQQTNPAARMTLELPAWRTVAPGLQQVAVSLLDLGGGPVSDATVFATGDVACLPFQLQEDNSGSYSGTIRIPPDVDGMRRTIQLSARREEFHETFATLSFFIEDPTWVVRNDHVERQLLAWERQYPDLLTLESFVTFEGYPTYSAHSSQTATSTTTARRSCSLWSPMGTNRRERLPSWSCCISC